MVEPVVWNGRSLKGRFGPYFYSTRCRYNTNVHVDGSSRDLSADEMLDGPDATVLVVSIEETAMEGKQDVWVWIS